MATLYLGMPVLRAADNRPSADQVFDKNSLPDPADKDEADTVLRRVGVLIAHLKTLPRCPDLKQAEQQLAGLKTQAGSLEAGNAKRAELLTEACKLRRKVAFANPLLDFNQILFIKRHFCPNEEVTGNHMCDQYFGFNAMRGGGLFVLEKPFSDAPTVRNVLEKSVCENGRYKTQSFTSKDGFLAPELSFDGKEVLFARTEIADNEADRKRYSGQGSENNTYKIFRVKLDGSGLTQLTDGTWNEFDPCYLPSGRIMFISERRGGYGRCHNRPVPSFTLHSMNADGSDIVMLSSHETNEWQPSVDNNGMAVYTRWDYVDRGSCQAHHAWTTTPDGRDPRAVNGNFSSSHGARPQFEISMRAIPGSCKYIGTAACHHGQAYGSIILVDPSVPDDNARPAAFRRKVSELKPDVEGSRPFSYPILIQPVLEKNCVDCHKKSQAEGKKAPDLTRAQGEHNRWFISYDSLKSYSFFWNNAWFDEIPDSKPGEIGARKSKLYQMLVKGHHGLKLSKEDMHRLTLWLDCNSDFYGAYEKIEEQKEGKVVWPSLE